MRRGRSIDGGIVFAVGHAGRMVATTQKTGERLWSLTVPSVQPPWVAGRSGVRGRHHRPADGRSPAATARSNGPVKLPGATTWSGPVLAGNRLWLTSSKGAAGRRRRGHRRVETTQDLGQPIFIAPVVAGGRMYVLTDKARLLALN